MTISVSTNEFKEKINLASSFLKSSIINAGLQNILLEISGKKIKIYSSNLSFFFVSEIDLEKKADEEKSFVFDPKKLVEILSFVSDDKVELVIKDKKFTLKTKTISASFPYLQESKYPKPKDPDKTKKVNLGKLTEALNLVLFSTATDDTKPTLTGVNFLQKEDGLTLASTDGFRLSVYDLKGISFDFLKKESVILPADFLKLILRQISDEEEVEIGFVEKENLFYFSVGTDRFYTRVIEGEFPPFQQVIPETYTSKITLDRQEFLKNIRIASVFAKEFSNVLIFEIKEDEIYIYPRVEEGERDTLVKQKAKVKGEEMRIAFNYRYVLDFVNNIQSDKVEIELLREKAPAVFRSEQHPEYLHIIMPVDIRS